LIRAVEPLEGIELMRKHRGCTELLDLTRGPGRLAAAFRINHSHDGIDLCGAGELWLGGVVRTAAAAKKTAGDEKTRVIGESVRIGITRAAERLWRFYEPGNPFVSGPKRLLEVRNSKLELRRQSA
jgi:DNA-3-methyladenine glycosylase